MERQSMVKDVIVELDGYAYRATYFTEGSVIHVCIDDRLFVLTAGPDEPANLVKAVLLEHALQQPKRE